ncbi:MAG: hypothetical protein JWO06_2750 [Bacteroidota bacterium]|nr:hypothetical protein [Bacteroidota bacterium]
MKEYTSAQDLSMSIVLWKDDVSGAPFGIKSFFNLGINIEPFLYEGEVADSDGFVFSPFGLDEEDLKGGRREFERDDFDESIYLFHSHNPVYLKAIEFQTISEQELKIKVELLFAFQFEGNGKNQLVVLEQNIPNPFYVA